MYYGAESFFAPSVSQPAEKLFNCPAGEVLLFTTHRPQRPIRRNRSAKSASSTTARGPARPGRADALFLFAECGGLEYDWPEFRAACRKVRWEGPQVCGSSRRRKL